MKKLQLLIFTILISLAAAAQKPSEDLWQQANKLYEQKNYDSAAALYEQIAEQDKRSATLYYNLGNTYYRLNNIGAAVLNYEKALKIKPGFDKAQENLELTRKRIPDHIKEHKQIFFIRWWKSITHPSTANVWAIISLILFVSFIGLLIYRKWSRKDIAYARRQVIATLITLWALTLIFALISGYKRDTLSHAVVMQAGDLHIQTGKTQSRITIPEGTTVKLVSTEGNKQYVQLPDGREGWMTKTALTGI